MNMLTGDEGGIFHDECGNTRDWVVGWGIWTNAAELFAQFYRFGYEKLGISEAQQSVWQMHDTGFLALDLMRHPITLAYNITTIPLRAFVDAYSALLSFLPDQNLFQKTSLADAGILGAEISTVSLTFLSYLKSRGMQYLYNNVLEYLKKENLLPADARQFESQNWKYSDDLQDKLGIEAIITGDTYEVQLSRPEIVYDKVLGRFYPPPKDETKLHKSFRKSLRAILDNNSNYTVTGHSLKNSRPSQ